MAQTKVRYNMYDFLSERYIRNFKKAGIAKMKKRTKEAFSAAFSSYIDMARQHSPNPESFLFNNIEAHILGEEFHWLYHSDRHVVFPSSSDLLSRVRQIKYNAHGAVFNFPFSSFLTVFPKGFSINSHPAYGVMITVANAYERINMINRFRDATGLENAEVIATSVDKSIPHIAINYASPHDESKPMVRALIPVTLLPEVLQAKNHHEYSEILGHFNTDRPREDHLTDEENDYQFELVKIICSMMVYMQAAGSDVLRDGLPASNSQVVKTVLTPRAMHNHTLHHPPGSASTKASPSEHYRTWTIRTLTHPRFYKGEWEDKPTGSRMVFVSDAWVSGKIDPKTLIDNKGT